MTVFNVPLVGAVDFEEDLTTEERNQLSEQLQGEVAQERGLTLTQLRAVEQTREKEAGPVRGLIRKLTGVRPRSERLEELFKTDKPISTAVKQSVEVAAGIIPFVIAPQLGALKGLSIAAKAGKVLTTAAKSGAVIGASQAVQELAQGEDPVKAASEGVLTGILGGSLAVGIPLSAKAIKGIGKGVFKSLSQVEGDALEAAIRNPDIIKKPQPEVLDVADNIVDTINKFGTRQTEKFVKRLEKIKAPPGNIVSSASARDSLISKEVNTATLRRSLKRVATSEALDISDNVLDRFVQGGNLSFKESIRVNSLLSKLEGSRIETIGSGLKGKVGSAKKIFLGEIEKQVPGTRRINKLFALSTKETNKLKKQIGLKKDGDIAEATVRSIGKQLLGKKTNKTRAARSLVRLDRRMGTKHAEQLLNSTAEDAFENLVSSKFLSTLRIGSGIAGGGALGGTPGALLGAGAVQALTGPGATKAFIQAGTAIAPVAAQAARLAAPAARTSLNEILFGEE